MSSPDSALVSGEPSDVARQSDVTTPATGARQRGPGRNALPLVWSAQPADARSKAGARAALLLSLALFAVLAPFAKLQLAAVPVFVPVNQTALIVCDLVTAALLFFQLRVTRSRALLLLACGYVFAALMALVHLLTFPGAFSPAGLLGAGPQTTGYLFVFWHTGFPLAVIGYALARKRERQAPAVPVVPVGRAVGITFLIAAALSVLAIAGSDLFPSLMEGNRYSSSFNVARYGQWVVTAVAVWVVWRSKPHSVLDRWLLVVLCNWFIEIALVAIFNAGRYDLGFYAGRVYALLASSFVLGVLLWEQARVYSGLGEAHETALSEADLRENRAVLRLAMEGGRMGAWSIDLRTDRVWLSAELEQIFGLPSGSFAGTRESCFELIHLPDQQAIREAIKAAVTQHQEFAVEFRFRHSSGELRWMDARGRAVDAQGRPTSVFGIGIDITSRRRGEEAATQIEGRFQTLADGIPQLAWMARPDGWIYWYNKRWYDYTGTTSEDMQGWGWQSVHDPQVLPAVMENWQRSIATGEHFEMVFPLRAANGEFRSFLTRVSPFRDADGNVVHWFGTNTDITVQREAEMALRAADRRKDEFLATLAHELRNPLAPIRNAVELMARAAPLPANLERVRGVLDRQSLHLARLVDDLLEVSRITQGKLYLRQTRISIVHALQDALEATRAASDAAGHQLIVSLAEDPLDAQADATRITQVFVNLLSNATKFTPAGGEIFVSAQRLGSDAVVSVRDTGIGIAAGHIGGIFEIFSQVTPALERSQGGLGIGLALVRGFAELHGGSVEARSAGAGQGTEFIVRLPLSDASSQPAASPLPPGTHEGSSFLMS